MLDRGNKPWKIFPAALLVVTLGSLSFAYGDSGRRPQGDARAFISARVSRDLAWSIETALEEASSRLGALKCQSIFSEFTDRSGRTLAENLQATGRSGSEYLNGMLFFDGTGESTCQRSDVLAFTSPGSRVVYLCGRRFAEFAHRAPGRAANILIHEELHSLGLGENPPTSNKITSRVAARCGV